MKRHYINDLDKTALLEFLQNDSLSIMNIEFLKALAIDQICCDDNTNAYILQDNVLYVKEIH